MYELRSNWTYLILHIILHLSRISNILILISLIILKSLRLRVKLIKSYWFVVGKRKCEMDIGHLEPLTSHCRASSECNL